MSAMSPRTDLNRESVMTIPSRTRRVLAAAAVIILVATGTWALMQNRAHRAEAAEVGPSAHAPAPVADPHAGHDMTGMATADGAIHLEPEMARALGVTVVEAELSSLAHTIRTTGNVTFDETRLTTVSPKFAGFVERLHVNFTGQQVRRGQPLLEIFSPELIAAQEELLTAIRMHAQLREGASPAVVDRTALLVDAARRRLLLWDVSSAQLQQIERSGQVRRTLTLHAPFAGVVTEKMVQAGQAVEMGMPLYRLADLSSVWVEADVYEQDLRFVRLGERVSVEIAAYPGESRTGRVSYIYPEVSPDSRTARLRVELANPGMLIKPGMFATVQIEAPSSERVVTVPRDAVMHSGTHAMVFIEESPGMYRAREVVVGAESGNRTQILSGLLAGERVVKRANFLLDSESRLRDSDPHMNH
jgi:membrane fusion protein, copper/silver efflux system